MSSPEIHLPQGYSLDTAPELEEIVGLLYYNVSDWVFRQYYTTRYRNERANHAQAGITFLSFGVRGVTSSDLIGIGEIILQADRRGIALTTQLSYTNHIDYYREIGFERNMASGSLLSRPAQSA